MWHDQAGAGLLRIVILVMTQAEGVQRFNTRVGTTVANYSLTIGR